MRIEPFQLERYYGEHEFTNEYQLSASDCESMSVGELLELAERPVGTLLDLRLGYTDTRGSLHLRSAIARLYPAHTPDDILVCNAPEEAIFLAMHSLLEAGDVVVVQTPAYQSLKEVAVSIGCEVRAWEAEESNGVWDFDVTRLDDLLTGAQLLVTNTPHNPTGWMPDHEQWEAITELVNGHEVRWFSDEMYRGLERDTSDAVTPAATATDRGISLWGMSKTFGLAGLRMGWLVSQDKALLRDVEMIKDYTSICSAAPSEVLAAAALGAASEIAARNRARIAGNEQVMAAFAAGYGAILTWLSPLAGSTSLARVHEGTASEHAEMVRTRANALLVPSAMFGMKDQYVRIGTGRADFPAAVQRWAAALDSTS